MMVSQSRHPGYQPVEKLRHGANGSFGECCKPVCGHLEGQERAALAYQGSGTAEGSEPIDCCSAACCFEP
jgi:hypothetical protein